MKYNVVKGNEVVKKNLSKKQAEEYCDKMNKEFKDKQESIRKQQHNAGTPLRKSKYELYKVEVVKESKTVRLSESDINRIVKKVIKEQSDEMNPNDLFRTYDREIKSEVRNIQDSIDTLERLYDDIEKEENLDEEDKDYLLSELHRIISYF